ncbi:hypothetical protein L6452_25101 [Arctium lappa]|uniref:Uncharacterized protein n=1 Tax=Arctium lappa TaxID=4217 RepID=A0ACB9ABG9_ARCLA|nr:hypothetical protein L6452_25101 [Arctium lappa]
MLFTVSTFPRHRRFPRRFLSFRLTATLAAESPTDYASNGGGEPSKLLLEVKDLTTVIFESGKEILNGVNLSIYEGEVKLAVRDVGIELAGENALERYDDGAYGQVLATNGDMKLVKGF